MAGNFAPAAQQKAIITKCLCFLTKMAGKFAPAAQHKAILTKFLKNGLHYGVPYGAPMLFPWVQNTPLIAFRCTVLNGTWPY